MPTLAANLRHAKPMRMKADVSAPDLSYLSSSLQLNESGDLLMGMILAEDQSPLFGVILLSPYSKHAWSGDEQIHWLTCAGWLVRSSVNCRVRYKPAWNLPKPNKPLLKPRKPLLRPKTN